MNIGKHIKIGLLLTLLSLCLFCCGRGYDLDTIRARAEAFDREITLSWYETDNYGRSSRMAQIYEEYQDLFADPRLVRFVQRRMHQEQDARQARRLKYLHRYLLEEFAGQKSKELDDRILDIQAQEVMEVGRQEVAFRDVDWELYNSPDRERRRNLYRARGEVIVSKVNPLLRRKLEIQRETCAQFGYLDYADFRDREHSADFNRLAQLCETLLYRTELMYRELLTKTGRQVLDMPIEEIRVYDRPQLFRGQSFDEYFPQDRMIPLLHETLEEMGIQLALQTNIDLDIEDRPEKEPRPACYMISIPGDIRVLVKPMGGAEDYESLFHEMGHAQHYANTEVQEYEFKALGESGVTESYAFLFENLFMDKDFLEIKVGMPAEVARAYLRQALMTDLSSLRYYCGLFLYEQSLHHGEQDPQWIYRSQWERARLTPMSLQEAEMDYLLANEDFYSVSYLEAWLLEAQLREALRREFGTLWFADPRAGQFLKRLWALGDEKTGEELARELGYENLDTQALRRQIERVFESVKEMPPGPVAEILVES